MLAIERPLAKSRRYNEQNLIRIQYLHDIGTCFKLRIKCHCLSNFHLTSITCTLESNKVVKKFRNSMCNRMIALSPKFIVKNCYK